MKKILIVDDSLMDRKLLMRVITKSGVENDILQAEDGEKGVEVLAQNHEEIALVFLDYQMPKMNGVEFLEATQKIPVLANIPIFMVTASSSTESKDLAYKANPGLAGYIVKPYKPDDILGPVKTHLK